MPFSGTVKGSFKKKFDFWAHVLKAPRPVLDIISNGYILPLMQLPNQFEGANQKSALTHSVFVDESVADLLDKGCVKVVHRTPHVCSPLLVVVNSSGKKRLVINLQYLNLFLWKDSFKYEDIRTALSYFEKDDFLFTFDLKIRLSPCGHP